MRAKNAAWQGKTALITGASSGIGAAAARRLSREGLILLLAARRVDRLQALCAELVQSGGQAEAFPVDLAIEDERCALVEAVMARHGSPDVLINNAGLGWYGYYSNMPWQLARGLLAVNVEAVMHLTNLFLPGMLQLGSGHLINIGSVAGEIPSQGVATYSASKAFINAFTTALYRELRGSGVHISVVRAGPVETEFFTTAADQPQGRRVPSQAMAVPVERVSDCIWSLLQRPRRLAYVPWVLGLTPWVEALLGGVMDRLGPLLLKRE